MIRMRTLCLLINCSSHCTHAYAVRKDRAKTLFQEAYECTSQSTFCGQQCEHVKCHIDQAYIRLGNKLKHDLTKNNWVLGYDLPSPDLPGHYGIIYQPRPPDYVSRLEDDSNYAHLAKSELEVSALSHKICDRDWHGKVWNSISCEIIERPRRCTCES